MSLKSTDYEAKAKSYLSAGFLGETYFHLNQFDSAAFYINQSFEALKKTNYQWSVPYLYQGKLHEHNGDLKKALEFYRVSINTNSGNADYIKGNLAIANLYKKISKIDSSIYYAQQAYAASKNSSIYIWSYETCELLKVLYKDKNLDSAFRYQELMLSFTENLYSRERINELQNVAIKEKDRQQALENSRNEFQSKLRLNILLGSTFTLFSYSILFISKQQA
ncbi:MAG: hypothetical protein U5K54_25245 [Cytophagales bacterium]|nr:hypothetical protein [Cytophagales bacterium]